MSQLAFFHRPPKRLPPWLSLRPEQAKCLRQPDLFPEHQTYGPLDPVTSPALTNETLSDLTGDGTVSKGYFRTAVSAGTMQASSASFDYIYGVASLEFEETSAFVNVTKHFKILKEQLFLVDNSGNPMDSGEKNSRPLTKKQILPR